VVTDLSFEDRLRLYFPQDRPFQASFTVRDGKLILTLSQGGSSVIDLAVTGNLVLGVQL
jgi:hypothetical protein